MQAKVRTLRSISSARRLMHATVALGLLLVFGFAQTGSAQTPTPIPLSLSNNYLVTGDYVVGGWVKGTSDGTFNTGTISIPDTVQAQATGVPSPGVPAGADIVAAFLYWSTVESSGTFAGQKGFFRGYPITGVVLGNPKAPVSWSSGGCVGAANGSKTMQVYRADVRPFLPIDANGKIQPNNTSYEVRLADTGKNATPPFPLGATLVMIFRILSPTVPLNMVLLYDGAFAPSNSSQIVSQPMQGFYQAGGSTTPVAKITHIVANGQTNKNEQVFLNNYTSSGVLVHSTPLPSLYPGKPSFPGIYNTSWDNPTWVPNNYPTTPSGTAVQANESSETTLVVPSTSNKGCVSWGAVILSTTVQNSDKDGILDVWKQNQGYCDAEAFRGMTNQGTCPTIPMQQDPSWVALAGAQSLQQDVFIQLDYMCSKVSNNADGTTTCDTTNGISFLPDPQALANVTSAFAAHGVNLHIKVNNNHVILEQTCADNTSVSPPQYCPFPGQAGVVGWKSGFAFLKDQPLNYPDETSCETQTPSGGTAGTGPPCMRRFPPGQRLSYHEVIFANASAVPNWSFQGGTLTQIAVPAAGVVTFTTSSPHGLAFDPVAPNGRVTVSNAISNPNLNGTFLVQSVPTSTSFTIQNANATTAPTQSTDPLLSVTSGKVGTGSGFSDVGGAHSLITLGGWGADGQTVSVESGTFMHELGHSLGLTHGGLYRVAITDGFAFTFEPNCKSNFQSVMNYLFQVNLLDGVLDYSEQDLTLLDENAFLATGVLASAIHPTTKWYAPNQPIGSPATHHCDGTPISPTDQPMVQPMFRLEGPTSSIPWPAPLPQDINFDGKIETGLTSLHGYNDWDNIDLRQIGATGNDFWVGGGVPSSTSGGGVPSSTSGGGVGSSTGGGGVGSSTSGGGVPSSSSGGGVPSSSSGGGVPSSSSGGGVGEIDVPTASSSVPTPTVQSATLNSSNLVQLTFSPPALFQSLISGFNIYRSKNGGPFSQLPPNPTVPVTPATVPPLLPATFTFIDQTARCATFTYFVTTVLTDGRESVPSNTSAPISVPCIFIGFLSPLSTASSFPTAPTFSGAVNQTSAVPIKWELTDGNGNFISDLSTLKFMQACPTTGANNPPPAGAVCVPIFANGTPKGSSTFRFSYPQFIFNWDTKSTIGVASGFWTIELQLSDGSAVKWTNIQF